MKTPSPTGPIYDDEADAKNLNGIANGDRQCFRALHDRYDGLLFTTINHVLNDRNDSEEVLQEVLHSMWQKAHLYTPERGRPVTWLSSLARNRAIDRLRAKKRQAKLKKAYAGEMEANPRGSTGVRGSEAAQRRDTCRAIRSAVLELTDLQREAIEKVYFEGLTQKETANQLGEPLGTVKARIRRGLASLRDNVDLA
ncbi:MAG: sigma-70 family RNA polymerase sigma factor [Verrucomicrobiales bacterium]|nr:sigma-70 family RNA polymerase sigma factor [Verrucomicrobiales bacterium]